MVDDETDWFVLIVGVSCSSCICVLILLVFFGVVCLLVGLVFWWSCLGLI